MSVPNLIVETGGSSAQEKTNTKVKLLRKQFAE